MDRWERELGWRLRRRRRGVLIVLLSLLPVGLIAFGWLPEDDERIAWAVGLFMVLGTLALGLATFLYRCPRCGTSLASRIHSGWGREQSWSGSVVGAWRSRRCPSCGLRESRTRY